ncbi:MAG: HlyD family efflux transporter periplasmic adaptor subunit, partial [Flavobacteriales bacterium]|nr:HlyD family efflux transporter periplasmic adaptor subunit [Flavobacteriales bacterium]
IGTNNGVANAEEIRKDREAANKAGTLTQILFNEVDSSITHVNAVPVKNKLTPITATGFGQVTSSSMINITAEVQGKINASILLKKGTSFKQGQVLFTIKNDDVKMALKARKSAYLMLMTNILPDLKLDYSDNFDAWLSFFNKIDVEKALPPLPETKSFKEKNFIVSNNVITEYYSIQSDEEKLKKYTITAPFSGSVINAFTDDGAIVNPSSPVLSVIRDGNLEIEVPISNDEISMVKLNSEVKLYDDMGGIALGKVSRIGTFVNPNTQTVPIFIEVKDSEIPLYNGMYLNASIACEGDENIVELPRKSIFNKNEVYQVLNGELKVLTLDIKLFLEESVLVKGLEDGTMIVVEPLINAKEGMKVQVFNHE